MKYHKNLKLSGFTLAEVLITLAIIGMVAAMTIPNLQSDVNDEQLKVGLKVAYSNLSQAIQKMSLDYDIQDEFELQKTFSPAFQEYLNVIKDYGNSGLFNSSNADLYKSLTGQNASIDFMNEGQFILSNGMTVFIQNGGLVRPIIIHVDVNGHEKKPNVLGRDVFTFQIIDNTLNPNGTVLRNCSLSSSGSQNGFGCTTKALMGQEY